MEKFHFEVGRGYTRNQICKVLGGDLVSNFPKHDGCVVWCCVSQYTHPKAPEIIFVNRSVQMINAAQQLAAQHEAIPVFVFKRYREDAKVYCGTFVVEKYCEDRAEIVPLAMKVSRQDVTALLYLKRVSD